MTPVKLLTAGEFCKVLGIKRKALYTRVERGQIPESVIVRFGKRALRFNVEAFNSWVTQPHASE